MPVWTYALPIVTVLIWASNTVVTRLAADAIDPWVISFDRWLLAGLVLTPFLIRRVWRARRAIRPHLAKLALLGLFGMVMYQGLAYFAAHTTTATNMGIIASLIPLLTAGLSALLLGEPPTMGMLGGGALSLLGLVVLITAGHPAALLAGEIHGGDAIMILAVAVYAAYGVLLRRWAIPVGTWESLFVQIWFAILFLLPGYLLAPASPITPRNLPLILFAALPTSILAPYLWMLALQRLGPNRTSVFVNLMPVFTALIAIVALGEALQDFHLVGGALALAGVVAAQQFRAPFGRPLRRH